MRISDCSSDGCSSDLSTFLLESLRPRPLDTRQDDERQQYGRGQQEADADRAREEHTRVAARDDHGAAEILLHQRAEDEAEQERRRLAAELHEYVSDQSEDRKSVVEGKRGRGRVELGGRRRVKKKKSDIRCMRK